MQVISHRGLHHEAPENTLEAFVAAANFGVDGIETDIRTSKDGELVLFHDRLTPSGQAVENVRRDELRRETGYHVPTLEEALTGPPGDTVKNWSELLWVLEIKTPAAVAPTINIVEQFCDTRKMLVISFWHEAVEQVAQSVNVECGLLVTHCPRLVDPTDPWLQVGGDFHERVRTIVWNYEFVDGEIVRDSKARGFRNYVYGVESKCEHDHCRSLTLDGAITDFPEFIVDN